MRKIILTKQQLNEVVDIAVKVEKDGDVNSAMSSAKEEADDALGVNTERNYVVNIEENETVLTDGEKIKQISSAIDLFWENCESDGDFEVEFTNEVGRFIVSPVVDFIMDNVNFDVSNDDYFLIKKMFAKTLKLHESIICSFTKKQLTEIKNKTKKRIIKEYVKSDDGSIYDENYEFIYHPVGVDNLTIGERYVYIKYGESDLAVYGAEFVEFNDALDSPYVFKVHNYNSHVFVIMNFTLDEVESEIFTTEDAI